MKITTKTTKQELKDILGANVASVKKQDKDLFDRIAYASKMAKADDSKVTRKDLADLVKEVITLLGDNFVEPALAQETPAETPVEPKAENSVKLNKKKKVEETPAETPAKEAEEVVDEKKSAKKSSKLGGKKNTPKKDGATESSEKTVQTTMFPQTLSVDGTDYELATDVKDMDDLFSSVEKDEQLLFAFYWTKSHLKQFPYFNDLLGKFKSFKDDFDLATCMYMSDEKKVAYCLSAYTEAFYTIMPDFLEEIDGIRYAQGIEFQIYRAI